MPKRKLETFKDIDLDNLSELLNDDVQETEGTPSEQLPIETEQQDVVQASQEQQDVGNEYQLIPEQQPIQEEQQFVPEEQEVISEEQQIIPEEQPIVTQEQVDNEEILRRVLFETDATIAQAKEQAVVDGNPELVEKLEELERMLEQERLVRQQLEMSNRIKEEEVMRLAEENTLLSTEGAQKRKIYGAVEEDPDLQAVMLYGVYSKENPEEYHQKYIESLKTLLRREGYDVDLLQQKAVANEKMALSESTQNVPMGNVGNVSSGGILDMFESLS